jgi:protein-L-isoaspartate(D-aspartate) O-methyltransferase
MSTTSPAGGTLDRRLHMVNSQLRTGDVVDQEVLAAFLEAPREQFVASASAPIAFLDRETPALGARTRRLLRPLTLARMLQAAAVKAGDRALDVGGGSGYGAALLDFMGAKVAALESDPGAAAAARELLRGRQGVTVREGPLDAGAADLAPFDVIVVEGAFRVYPDVLIRQLAEGGRLVGIDAITGAPQAALYERRGEGVSRRALFETTADTLDGFQPAASFAF